MFVLNHAFTLPVGETHLTGELTLPQQATGLILLAHRTHSDRFCPRSRHIRRLLQQQDLGTFSVDLLTPREEGQQGGPADSYLLTQRLITTTQWVRRQSNLLGLRIGLLGQEETATVALNASLELYPFVGAVVSFGGYLPEAAPMPLPIPTLLLEAETTATHEQRDLGSLSQVRTVSHADRLFQEHSVLAQATQQAAAWFTIYLAKPSKPYYSEKG